MKLYWWMAGLIAVVAGGSLLLLRARRSQDDEAYHFVDDEVALKNFGEFPPELPEDEFDSVNFLF